MICLEQARKELEAICDFDSLFVADEYDKDSSELIGFIVRQCRKQELLELRAIRATN
jgi:hypothetical protein